MIEAQDKKYFIRFPERGLTAENYGDLVFSSEYFPINGTVTGRDDEGEGEWSWTVGGDHYFLQTAPDVIILHKNDEEIFIRNFWGRRRIRFMSEGMIKGFDALKADIKRRKDEVRNGFDSLRRSDFFREHNFSLNPAHGPGREIRDFL